jgi:hypothetical protein
LPKTLLKAPGFEVLKFLNKLFFWNYERNTWQWDALCVAILIFIFLTPKSWWENSERRAGFAHQSSVASILLIDRQTVENAADTSQLQQQLRSITGRPELQVLSVRKVTASDGTTKGYEVDIR